MSDAIDLDREVGEVIRDLDRLRSFVAIGRAQAVDWQDLEAKLYRIQEAIEVLPAMTGYDEDEYEEAEWEVEEAEAELAEKEQRLSELRERRRMAAMMAGRRWQ